MNLQTTFQKIKNPWNTDSFVQPTPIPIVVNTPNLDAAATAATTYTLTYDLIKKVPGDNRQCHIYKLKLYNALTESINKSSLITQKDKEDLVTLVAQGMEEELNNIENSSYETNEKTPNNDDLLFKHKKKIESLQVENKQKEQTIQQLSNHIETLRANEEAQQDWHKIHLKHVDEAKQNYIELTNANQIIEILKGTMPNTSHLAVSNEKLTQQNFELEQELDHKKKELSNSQLEIDRMARELFNQNQVTNTTYNKTQEYLEELTFYKTTTNISGEKKLLAYINTEFSKQRSLFDTLNSSFSAMLKTNQQLHQALDKEKILSKNLTKAFTTFKNEVCRNMSDSGYPKKLENLYKDLDSTFEVYKLHRNDLLNIYKLNLASAKHVENAFIDVKTQIITQNNTLSGKIQELLVESTSQKTHEQSYKDYLRINTPLNSLENLSNNVDPTLASESPRTKQLNFAVFKQTRLYNQALSNLSTKISTTSIPTGPLPNNDSPSKVGVELD